MVQRACSLIKGRLGAKVLKPRSGENKEPNAIWNLWKISITTFQAECWQSPVGNLD